MAGRLHYYFLERKQGVGAIPAKELRYSQCQEAASDQFVPGRETSGIDFNTTFGGTFGLLQALAEGHRSPAR